MIGLFVSAFFLGLVFNATPGAVFAESFRQGLKGGFPPAFHVQIGSLVGDATWAILGLAGAGVLLQQPTFQWPMGILSSGLLIYLGIQAIRDIDHEIFAHNDANHSFERRRSLLVGMMMSLSNPLNIAYWAALGGVMAGLGIAQPQWSDFVVFFLGFMTSSILWCFICAGLISGYRRILTPKTLKISHWACGLALIFFGLGLLSNLLCAAVLP